MGNIEMTCIICLEQMTNYSSKYVYYCDCKYDAHDECIEKCKKTNCLFCGAQGHKLGNFFCSLIGYFVLTYGWILIFSHHIHSILLCQEFQCECIIKRPEIHQLSVMVS